MRVVFRDLSVTTSHSKLENLLCTGQVIISRSPDYDFSEKNCHEYATFLFYAIDADAGEDAPFWLKLIKRDRDIVSWFDEHAPAVFKARRAIFRAFGGSGSASRSGS